jgi:hypothetical protein
MRDSQYRLVKHFAKPEPGEFVPIGFIEMTRETVAWSPKLNQSIFVTADRPNAGELKRVSEVNAVRVVNYRYFSAAKKWAGKQYPFLNFLRKKKIKNERKKMR